LHGAVASAAELADHAVRVTPVDATEDRLRRLLAAADLHRWAGDATHATELLSMAMAIARTDDEQATVLAQRGDADGPPRSIRSYVDALAVAQDHALRASIHLRLADAMGWGDGTTEQIRHAELAVAEASRTSDSTLMCRALGIYGAASFYAGRGVLAPTMSEAMAVERSLPEWPLEEGPTVQFLNQLMWSFQPVEGRALCGEIEEVARRRQDHYLLIVATYYLGMILWRAGEWSEADRLTLRVVDLEAQYGDLAPTAYFPASIVAAHQGRVPEARERAQAGIARADATGVRLAESGYRWVLGFVDLSLGDAAAAVVNLRRSYEIRGHFMLEPAQRVELGDLLEALIALGELDEADGILATWYPRAEAVQRWWSLGVLARGQALLAAARSDLLEAFEKFQLSLEYHERANDPFQHARTLLALGRTQRRAKQRATARATLTEALARFDRLGAALWAEQTRAEIARIGGRSAAPQELTEAERRIADLVGQGRSNREVAAALYLAEHSVEAALTRIYRKLGVGSRTALARLLAAKS
jgi:DNA-binding CsgD family transcriptional regulator